MKDRNLGADALRAFSMYMVVILHILGPGGLLAAAEPLSMRYGALWLMEILCYGAVDCYALLTGYMSVDVPFRWGRLVRLWLQVAFYTITITSVTALSDPGSVDLRGWLAALFPMLNRQYWYFTAYFGLFCCIPFLNKLINGLDGRWLTRLAATLFLLLSLLPCAAPADIFNTNAGYSMLWLAALYVIGAWLKRVGAGMLRGKKRWLLLYLGCGAAVWGAKLLLGRLAGRWPSLPTAGLEARLVSYTFPLILIGAVALTLFALRCAPRGPVTLLSKLSFGVYLIHTNQLLWRHLLAGRFLVLTTVSLPWTLLGTLVAAGLLYLVCIAADALRMGLFRLIHLNGLADRVETLIVAADRRLLSHIPGQEDPTPADKR